MDNKCTHCNKTLGEDFAYLNFGGLLKNGMSDTIESFCTIGTHSHTNPTPYVDIEQDMQFNEYGQAESNFCNKQCLTDWFINEIKDID